mgnify:CR=1 FL=1
MHQVQRAINQEVVEVIIHQILQKVLLQLQKVVQKKGLKNNKLLTTIPKTRRVDNNLITNPRRVGILRGLF